MISTDFPASIVREGGLSACLTYLDFFPTSTQRKAVTTAANCCRNIPADSFSSVRDVMPVLLNVLSSSDQKVVEQSCLCVSRMVDSFKHRPDKLEELISPELLQAVLRLLLPGTTNLIGQNVHTQLIRVIAITARSSPRLSVELLKLNVVDTLYQMLTGVSPPADSGDSAAKSDSVVVMQALIHRPKEQISETLNVVCELLPSPPDGNSSFEKYLSLALEEATREVGFSRPSDTRVRLLEGCKPELKRFSSVLLPTLTDAYSSTVNLSVRQKVLSAQVKILSIIESQSVEDALRNVQYSSFLASILSQQDHPSLVFRALQIANLLCEKLPHIYRYQFHREGVITEIQKLADKSLSPSAEKMRESMQKINMAPGASDGEDEKMHSGDDDEHDHQDREERDEDDDEDIHDDDHDHDDDDQSSESDSGLSVRSLSECLPTSNTQDFIILRAQAFMAEQTSEAGNEMREKAVRILEDMRALSQRLLEYYSSEPVEEGSPLFAELAAYFESDALESITSSELLNSGIIRTLLEVLDPLKPQSEIARAAFLEAFMGSTSETTPFATLIEKLQDLLSRSEHFEVITVHHGATDINRSSATSMLGKQIRLKLVAEDENDVPKGYKMLMVSIHAICTFKALDDYLRPRITLSERPLGRRPTRDSLLAQLAEARRLQALDNQAGERNRASARDHDSARTPAAGAASTSRGRNSRSGNKKAPATPTSADAENVASSRRRSSRRHQQPPPPDTPPARAPRDSDDTRDPLECADERQLTDDEEGEEDLPPQTIVDDLEDGLSDDDVPDPTAVNMEVAATGGVTARQEDGTRVATPKQSSTPTSTPTTKPSTPSVPPAASGTSLATAGRPMSYAAAISAIPQDWHIEFSIDDCPISSETTVYRAVHHNRQHPHDAAGRAIWSAVHTIKYKRVRGPPAADTGLTPPPEETSQSLSGMPTSLDDHPTTSSILRLFKVLHDINSNLDEVLIGSASTENVNPEPISQFINTKLTAKLNRQMEEPLIVASNCLPNWSEDLARFFPFLFPFETRHLFLQSTSFGYSRSMMRWQNTQPEDDRNDRRRDDRPMLGRLQRQKVRISRSRILESAVKVMELYGSSPSVLEVEYFEEVGTGLGPTLEFYSTVSKEFSKKKLKLWRENESNDKDEYAFGNLGLFPAPMSQDQAESEFGKKLLHLFKMLGKFVARSMLDSRIIDISFNPTFFRIGEVAGLSASLGAIKAVDADLAKSLLYLKKFADMKKKLGEDSGVDVEVGGVHVEDLGLDFTLPGYPTINLIPEGNEVAVTIDNVGDYINKVVDFTIGSGVKRQIDAFRSGFSQVFPYTSLKTFTPGELVMLFGRTEEDWSIESKSSMKTTRKHGTDNK